MRNFRLFFAFLILSLSSIIMAQESCDELISTALEKTDSACETIGRNEACYGHQALKVEAYVSDLQFETPGDIAELADIESLQLSSLSLDEQQWGIALMQVQANLPDSLPGQNVTFLLFGDVNISDASEQIVEIPVTATNGVNVRQRPNTDSSILASLSSGQEVTATGRLSDSSWIHIRLEDATEGWVSANFLKGDIKSLIELEPNATVFGPMQAFYFRTGIGANSCVEVSENGILIQTPKGVGTIELSINNVDVQLGSTIFLQAIPGDAMYIYVIEGHAVLNAFGVSQLVPAGAVSMIPLDADGVASDSPQYPEPYSDMDKLALLLDLLPISVSIAPPLSPSEVEIAISTTENTASANQETGSQPSVNISGLPPSGTWKDTGTVLANTCDPAKIPVGQVSTGYPQLTFSDDYSSLFFDFGAGYSSFNFYRTSDNNYSYVNDGMVLSLTFTSSTTFFLTHRGNYGDPNAGGCIYYQDENGVYVGN